MTDALVGALADVVGPAHALTDPDLTATFTTDWNGRPGGSCRAVVRPVDTAQVAAVLRICTAHRVAVVPQGGNTGLVRGGVPRGGEVVLSLGRLTDTGPVDTAAGQVTAGAGVTVAQLHRHAAAAGMAYGVDLASRDSATVGGTIATNAGGVNVVRYGATRSQVVGVEAVLADGRVLRRMQGLAKDSTGYDLPGLLTGSEGTLAVVTAARLRLHPRPAARVVALIGVDSTRAALDVLAAVRSLTSISAVEWFHRAGLEMVCANTGLPQPLPTSSAAYVLVECAAAEDPTAELAAALDRAGVAGHAAVVDDRTGRERLWAYRERHSDALAAEGVGIKLDVAVPPDRLAEVEFDAERLCRAAGGRLISFGHLAEGNIHANVMDVDADHPTLHDELVRLVAAHGGSLSAEHGVGTDKVRWLPLFRDDADRAAMHAVKRALDPDGLLNPGVLLPQGDPNA